MGADRDQGPGSKALVHPVQDESSGERKRRREERKEGVAWRKGGGRDRVRATRLGTHKSVLIPPN